MNWLKTRFSASVVLVGGLLTGCGESGSTATGATGTGGDTAGGETTEGGRAGGTSGTSGSAGVAGGGGSTGTAGSEGAAGTLALSCTDGDNAKCGSALGAKGACAMGTTTCAGGVWGDCSTTPATFDRCVIENDDMCTGVPITDVVVQSGFVMPNPASTGLPNPASYTTNADGTVTDNVTGLIWQTTVDPESYTQAQAATYCANLGAAWRLPTRVELVSLVDFTNTFPGLTINQTYFPNTPGAAFWTSSVSAGASGYAWIVGFDSGIASDDVVASPYRVRCVR